MRTTRRMGWLWALLVLLASTGFLAAQPGPWPAATWVKSWALASTNADVARSGLGFNTTNTTVLTNVVYVTNVFGLTNYAVTNVYAVTNNYTLTNTYAVTNVNAVTNNYDFYVVTNVFTNYYAVTNTYALTNLNAELATNAINATNFVGTSLNISGTLSAGTVIVTNGIDGTNITSAVSNATSAVILTGYASDSSISNNVVRTNSNLNAALLVGTVPIGSMNTGLTNGWPWTNLTVAHTGVITNGYGWTNLTVAHAGAVTNGFPWTNVTVATATIAVGATNDDAGSKISTTYLKTFAGVNALAAGAIVTNGNAGAVTLNGAVTANATVTAYNYSSATNSWAFDTAIPYATNVLVLVSGAATGGITGISGFPTTSMGWVQLCIKATGTVVLTNIASIGTSDFLTSRTITNGNKADIAIEYLPGQWTNMAIVQYK